MKSWHLKNEGYFPLTLILTESPPSPTKKKKNNYKKDGSHVGNNNSKPRNSKE